MRVLLADPPAFTPTYDHELAAALARGGAEVELATSRFRYGTAPAPLGYRRRELFYPLSSRLFRRSRLRLPLKVLEHPLGLARLALAAADVLHLQWLAAPELDRRLLRHRAPLVFTAHDLLPRRTAGKHRLWRRLFDRFERVVVHTERGRDGLAAFGVPAERLRVIPHPVTPSDPPRTDDGRTVLALGVIRPYKQVEHAAEAVGRIPGARLLVAGDPVGTLPALDGAELRLGYLSEQDVLAALGDATVAVFPYRAELDQSGALLQALGAGVPSVVYDVGGLAEPVRAFGAGRVVPADDVDGLAAALRELVDDEVALAEARAGALHARETLTWDAAGAAHLDLYGELL
jgi:glycosyltransferase involved in cell wall biosynthesis